MTDYNNYNEFLNGSIFRPSKKKNEPVVQAVKTKQQNQEKKWFKVAKTNSNNNIVKTNYKPTIDVGDIVELLYIDTGEKIKVVVFDNYLKKEVRFNDNPKTNRGTKAFVLVPDKITKDNSMSILSEVYNLIKYKKSGDIIEYNGKRIKVLSIKKRG